MNSVNTRSAPFSQIWSQMRVGRIINSKIYLLCMSRYALKYYGHVCACNNIIIEFITNAEEEEHNIAAVQKAMEEKGMLGHTIVHGVFVGPARSGKNSLMERLLGQMPSSVSPSTGVAESVVQVKVIQKAATFAANVEEIIWSEMDYDDEAIKLMLINSESKNKVGIPVLETWDPVDTFNSEDNSSKAPVADIDLDKTGEKLATDSESNHKQYEASLISPDDQATDQPTTLEPHSQLPDSYVPPIEIFKDALRNKGYEALKQHFEKTWSLYLTNTGGQMEFQEVLPLLVSGPSIFFFTFRLDRDLHEYYTIEYELSDGKKSYPYTSTLSTIDGMMQTLASISAMGTFVYSGLHRRDKPLQPKVFFVGTHKDQLESKLADTCIAHVDKQLQDIIRSTMYYNKDLVEFASESQLIFTVNNFSESDSDFKHIRSAVQRVVTRNEFQMTSPTHWLIFSLALRKLKDHIISYDLCLEIARHCGLSDNELNEALHFIHSKMGLIRFFPYEDIKSLVFIDPQSLFDKVTELIVSTFTFDKVGLHEMEQFKHKGIFSLEKLEEVSGQDHNSTVMSTFQFGKLLERLRIVAPLNVANKTKYFLPCVLAHAHESDSHLPDCDTPVPTLLISFECGYIPKGTAGALIKYLMANEMESPIEWTLQTDRIFKNQVSFCVGPYDTLMLRIFPTHFEITCIPDSQFSDDERDDFPVRETCIAMLKAIDSGVKQILQDLNYIKTHHCVTFPCPADVCKGGHPTQLNWYRGSPRSLQCNIKKRRLKLPKNVCYWESALKAINPEQHKQAGCTQLSPPAKRVHFEEQESHSAVTAQLISAHTRLDRSHHANLLLQLTKDASDWRKVGTYLGFVSGELENIQSNPSLFCKAPTSWLSELLTQWLQWAPGDIRGSTSFATLEDLKTALNQAGLGVSAHDLKI